MIDIDLTKVVKDVQINNQREIEEHVAVECDLAWGEAAEMKVCGASISVGNGGENVINQPCGVVLGCWWPEVHVRADDLCYLFVCVFKDSVRCRGVWGGWVGANTSSGEERLEIAAEFGTVVMNASGWFWIAG